MTGNKLGHDSGPHHQTRAFCESKKGQLRPHVTVLFQAQYKQWVQVYTLNMLMYRVLLFSVYECLIGSYKSAGSTLIYQNEEVSAT